LSEELESAYLSVELECGCAQVHQAEEQRKVEQDARTLYIRFNKTYPSSHDEIKVREEKNYMYSEQFCGSGAFLNHWIRIIQATFCPDPRFRIYPVFLRA